MKTFERLDEEYHASPKSAEAAETIALLALKIAVSERRDPKEIALWSLRYEKAGNSPKISDLVE